MAKPTNHAKTNKTQDRPLPTPEELEQKKRDRLENPLSARFNLAPRAGFPKDVTKELAALIGLDAEEKVTALRLDLDAAIEGCKRIEGVNPDLDAFEREAKGLSAMLIDVLGNLHPMPTFRHHLTYRHSSGSVGFDADVKAIERVAKTLGNISPKRGAPPSVEYGRAVAVELAVIYQRYSGEKYTFRGYAADGEPFMETMDGERFVGLALKTIFPGITQAQKKTVMKGLKKSLTGQ